MSDFIEKFLNTASCASMYSISCYELQAQDKRLQSQVEMINSAAPQEKKAALFRKQAFSFEKQAGVGIAAHRLSKAGKVKK